jgi:hypothetical protein
LCEKISRGPEVMGVQSEYDNSKKTKGGNNMYYDINRLLVEEKMKELREYAYASNVNGKSRKKLETFKQQLSVQGFKSKKIS